MEIWKLWKRISVDQIQWSGEGYALFCVVCLILNLSMELVGIEIFSCLGISCLWQIFPVVSYCVIFYKRDLWVMMISALITFNSSFVRLIEGLCSTNPWEFGSSGNWTVDLGINSPSLWPTEPRLQVNHTWSSSQWAQIIITRTLRHWKFQEMKKWSARDVVSWYKISATHQLQIVISFSIRYCWQWYKNRVFH